VNGKYVGNRDLNARLKQVENSIENTNKWISIQKFYPLADIKKVFQRVEEMWDTDGLVFTPISMKYKYGYNPEILKWKPKNKRTVDFELKKIVQEDNEEQWQLNVQGNNKLEFFGWIDKQSDQFEEGAIIECYWDTERITKIPTTINNSIKSQGSWKFSRFRVDKDTPNANWVVKAILEELKDSVEEEDLISVLST